jgi:tRNA 2-thiouridine synthesizing protein A
MADRTLDVKGLACPLPVLKAKKIMRELPKGSVLEVIATDPLSPADFEVFCRTSGHRMIESSQSSGVFRFLIEAG